MENQRFGADQAEDFQKWLQTPAQPESHPENLIQPQDWQNFDRIVKPGARGGAASQPLREPLNILPDGAREPAGRQLVPNPPMPDLGVKPKADVQIRPPADVPDPSRGNRVVKPPPPDVRYPDRFAPAQTAPPMPRDKAPLENSPALPNDRQAAPLERQASPDAPFVLPRQLPHGIARPGAPSMVVIDKTHHVTHVLQWNNGRLEDVFDAKDTVGSNDEPDTATPEGRVVVDNKRWDPIWTPPKSIDINQTPIGPYSADQNDPLGVAFIRLKGDILHGGAYGMHGTNNPLSIGYSLSHGCIRHQNEDIAKIMGLVDPGTPVYIMPNFEGTKVLASDLSKMR